MGSKFKIVNRKWIVTSSEQEYVIIEKSIRIASISGMEIQFGKGKQVTWIRLYSCDKSESFQLWYEAKDKKQFEKDVKLLKGLIYK